MASFNKVILMGNLTRDPDLKTLPSGQTVCEFTIAVSEKYKDKETTAFIGCVAFGKTGETIAKWKKKGEPLLVEGKLSQDNWNDKETGQKRTKTKVTVFSTTFVGSKPQESNQQSQGYTGGYGGGTAYAQSLPDEPDF